ncbi:hypothetical protein ABT337_27410 [Saccharopolyspora hirsuta]|uniref:CU044_5270 family protein n=1 Tax=Saccharopolyspora hirsuta TaxID=1837 RepID=A0A5M7C3T9_SACHI|nr:hypothetical protein [Saccharopolyspora hirsuta]KAA5837056.1 hypothetical protein F1721_04340 [Saccharopolyspora hirsuta]
MSTRRPGRADRAVRALRAANPVQESDVDISGQRALFDRIVATPRTRPTRPPVRRWVLAVSASAAAAVVVVSAVLSLPTQASAAELLERAAGASSTYREIPVGRAAYQQVVTTKSFQERGFRYSVDTEVATRVAPDGYATTATTVGAPVFADPAGHERWVREGRPQLPGTAGGGESSGPVVYRVGGAQLDFEELGDLPTDPAALTDRLRRLAPEQDLFDSVRQLMVAPGVPGDLRAALYRVLAGVPGVEPVEETPERVTVGHGDDRLTFDPRSGALLAASGAGSDVVIRSAGLVNCVEVGVRPTSLTLACADANYVVEDLRWSSWGGAVAEADGTAVVNSCEPSCAEGVDLAYPVRVVLDQPRSCGLNLTSYTRVAVHYRADVPAGLARDDVQELPCGP